MKKKSGFTLIELLVVIAILALLMSILLPALSRARERAKTTRCLANLSAIGRGLTVYQAENDNYVVPSYNMPAPGTSAAVTGDVIDGWPVILDRDGVVPGSQGLTANVFYCPNTLDVEGMKDGQTAWDLNKPSGYQDWPILFTSSGGDGATKSHPTLPTNNPRTGQPFGDSNGSYEHLIRCGYWFNSQNPIGSAPSGSAQLPPLMYSQSVGYGPYPAAGGAIMGPIKATRFVRPSALIAAADGMYMGRQTVTRLGQQNRRIGYRHPGRGTSAVINGASMSFPNSIANAVFADGHAESIENDLFPVSSDSATPLISKVASNQGNYTVFADPDAALNP